MKMLEPAFSKRLGLWVYGNIDALLMPKGFASHAVANLEFTDELKETIELEAEQIVFNGRALVTALHNDAWQTASIVPLRWGCPRIMVVRGGFKMHLGNELKCEPFWAARLWRYGWDPSTDLIVSRDAPDVRKSRIKKDFTTEAIVRYISEYPMVEPFDTAVKRYF